MADPAAPYESTREEVAAVLVGNEELVERLTVTLLTRSHVLIEGVPGMAKTTATDLFATATGLDSQRIQMVSDSHPADITGTHVYLKSLGKSVLQRGPIFSNLVVADEINRVTPKTQSVLPEAMQMFQETIEGETLELPVSFMIIAIQNPIEMEGTFELPEAQRDRFTFKLTVDTPSRMNECELPERFDDDATLDSDDIDWVLSGPEIVDLQAQVRDIHVADSVKDYILDIIRAVCESSQVEVGASPRVSLTFLNTPEAPAAIHGRKYATCDDVKSLVHLILRHRVVLSTEADLSEQTTDEILMETIDNESPLSEHAAEAAVTLG